MADENVALPEIIKSYFYPGPDGMPVSDSALGHRRRISELMAARSTALPKTFGEGLASMGRDIGEGLYARQLREREAAQAAQQQRVLNTPTPGASGPPGAAGPPVAAPSPLASTPYAPGMGGGPPANPTSPGTSALLAGSPEVSPEATSPDLASVAGGSVAAVPPGGGIEPPNPVTPTTIQPAPTRLAGEIPERIPGIYDKPAGLPQGMRLPGPGVNTMPVEETRPVAPPPTPRTPEEIYAQKLLTAYPESAVIAAHAQRIAAPGVERRQQQDAFNKSYFENDLKRWEEAQKQKLAHQLSNPVQKAWEDQQKRDKAAREEREAQRFGTLGAEESRKLVLASAESTKNIPASSMAIATVRGMLPEMFVGGNAQMRVSLEKLRTLVGVPAEAINPKMSNTQAFQAIMAPLIAQLRSTIVGTGPQSVAEFQSLVQAAGADFTMQPQAIEKILGQVERLNLRAAISNQEQIARHTAGDENDMRQFYRAFGVKNMVDLVPQQQVNDLLADPSPENMKEFDAAFHTPGLARDVIAARGRR